ncbi:TonB-dependent receptor [Massilia sp. R2A-15]|uniref:TonB-dependent receptor n=1 Tax=Massilia sp. R2A-15 TaxID=3064278 RepID=UPI0027373FB0|nr:TonB-dependent receptor [Massilia sp. R2A-15]WLI90680.1 TonB-dependent receptor [Massilia sp. R2A-15]
MIFKQKPVAAAVSMAMWSLAAFPALAQTEAPAQMQTVEVTGIRASMAKSLNVKKNSSANVEVITAEDVGKMPDKNLADSLQRLAGVAVRTDYDEAEKVSMRGTNPDMSLILFNGHTVSGGDWYVGDQTSSSRSTSLSLMPSSVLNQAVVYKTSQANIADGGMAGTINVSTRKPLAQKEQLSGVVSAGMSYADLPGKSAPDMSASVNWKNEAGTFGFIAQGFAEKRYIRRDSSSRLAYGTSSGWDVINTATMKGITDESLAGTGYKASDLNGVRMPGSMATEFVEGVRDRKGGMLSMEFKPNKDLDVTMTGFHSSMNANNYGRANMGAMYSMLLGKASITDGATTAASPNTNSNGQQVFAMIKKPVIVNETTLYGDQLRVLKSADIVFPDGTTPQYIGNNEGFYREGANATSGFLDLDGKYRVNSDLTVKGLFSTTEGVGKTDADQGLTYARFGTGTSYALNGLREAPFVKYYGAGPMTPGLNADGSGNLLVLRTLSGLKTSDKERSLQFDAQYSVQKGWLESVESGVRYSDHHRDSARRYPAYRSPTSVSLNNAVPTSTIAWPSDFGAGLGGTPGWDNTGFTWNPEALKAYFAANTKTTTDEFERRIPSELHMRERQGAAYVMANLEGEGWSGNVGLRVVKTRVNADIPTPIPAGVCLRTEPGQPATTCAAFPDAITTAGDLQPYYDNVAFKNNTGNIYYFKKTDRTYNNVLPSLNLRYELTKDQIVRFGASETIGRQNYNLLGAGFGSPVCDAQGCRVTGPNPDLKPMISKNIDASWAWYFAPRSLVSANVFYSKIDGYAKTGNTGTSNIDLYDSATSSMKTYSIVTSSQQGAHIGGIELSYEQPFGKTGFGFTSNVSRAKTKVDDGRPMIGASEYAANLGGYFENDKFSSRLVWNYRSEYVTGSTAPAPTTNSQGLYTVNGVTMPGAPTISAPVATLAFNASYNISPKLVVSFDATNLTNVRRAQYRYSEEEQSKLDVSGRQYYVNLKYKF